MAREMIQHSLNFCSESVSLAFKLIWARWFMVVYYDMLHRHWLLQLEFQKPF